MSVPRTISKTQREWLDFDRVILSDRDKKICQAIIRSLGRIGVWTLDIVMRDPVMQEMRVHMREASMMLDFMGYNKLHVIKERKWAMREEMRYTPPLIWRVKGRDLDEFCRKYKIYSV